MKNPPKIFRDAKNIEKYIHKGEIKEGRLCSICRAPSMTIPEIALVRLIRGE
jgi:hypothetical protein